jgi:hypothetical protein
MPANSELINEAKESVTTQAVVGSAIWICAPFLTYVIGNPWGGWIITLCYITGLLYSRSLNAKWKIKLKADALELRVFRFRVTMIALSWVIGVQIILGVIFGTAMLLRALALLVIGGTLLIIERQKLAPIRAAQTST